MNNVCTHIVRLDMTYKKLRYYAGNYDMYCKLRRDQDNTQVGTHYTHEHYTRHNTQHKLYTTHYTTRLYTM